MNHLITRINEAIQSDESVLLNQFYSDISDTFKGKEIHNDELDLVVDGKEVLIKDKVHNESTRVIPTVDGFKLEGCENKKVDDKLSKPIKKFSI